MNIILGGQTLQYPLTGIGWYTWHLLQGFKSHRSVNQVLCIPEIDKYKPIDKRNFFLRPTIKKILSSTPGSYKIVNYLRNKNFKIKSHLLANKNFIYHEPSYILKPYNGNKICTVHDLSHIHFPEFHPKARVRFLNENLQKSLKNAHHIITGSEYIRKELIKLFLLPNAKITCINHGASKVFKPRSFKEIKKRLQTFNLHDKCYLLSVGTLEPRKNLDRLICAYQNLPNQMRTQFPLVLVGMKGWNIHHLEKKMRTLIKKQQLYCLGYVSKEELPFIYSGAHGFIYISLYEGFGLPLLESIASGVPTLSSNRSAMPEVVGAAAMLVDPYDIDMITAKINQLINDISLREKLKQLGPIQAARFSWDSCIENTIAVYRKILSN